MSKTFTRTVENAFDRMGVLALLAISVVAAGATALTGGAF